jgi:hypothetical protein
VTTRGFLQEVARRSNPVALQDPPDGNSGAILSHLFPFVDGEIRRLVKDPRLIFAKEFVQNEDPKADLEEVTRLNLESQVEILKKDYPVFYCFGERVVSPNRERGQTEQKRLTPVLVLVIGLLLNARSERVNGMQKWLFLLLKSYGASYPCLTAMSDLGLVMTPAHMDKLLNQRAEKVRLIFPSVSPGS